MFHSAVIPVPKFVAFDLETTGLNPDEDEIVEVALIKFEYGQVVSRYTRVIKPEKRIPLKVRRLTHIKDEEILSASPLGEVIPEIEEFRRDYPLVGHNSPFDLAFLSRRIDGFPGVDVYDTLELCRIMLPTLESYRLSDVADSLNVDVNEAHRAYDDAEVSGRIFDLIQREILKMKPAQRRRLALFLERESLHWRLIFAPPIGDADDATSCETGDGVRLVQKSLLQPSSSERVYRRETIAWARTVLRQSCSGDGVSGAPYDKLAPEVLAHEAVRIDDGLRRVIIGIPRECLPKSAKRISIPSRYLCQKRYEILCDLASKGAFPFPQDESRQFFPAVARWAESTETGDLREVTLSHRYKLFYRELGCTSEESCPPGCRYAGECYERLSRRNPPPTVFATYDEVLEATGRFDEVVVWNLRDMVSSYEWMAPRVDLESLSQDIRKGDLLDHVPSLQSLVDETEKIGRQGVASSKVVDLARSVRDELAPACKVLRDRLGDYDVDPPFLSSDLHRLESWVESLADMVKSDDETIITVEDQYSPVGRRGKVLVRRAVRPAELALSKMRENLGSPALVACRPIRMVSPKAAQKVLPVKELLYLILDHHPVPGRDDYAEYLKGIIVHLSSKIASGLYVIFPSRSLLEETYRLVSDVLEDRGVVVYAQGIDGGWRVLEHLGEDRAVVFVTARSGPPGSYLPDPRCVLVAKVPFGPPSPLNEVRRREAQLLGMDPFVEVNVKDAAMALVPHFERLLESEKGGVFLIADPKVLPGKSWWGQAFLKEMSDAEPIVCPLAEASNKVLNWLYDKP